jgi:hypothetical protein
MNEHANVGMALCAAQAEMGPLIKGAENPHFKNRYADLAGVVDAVREPFAKNGLAYYHTIEYIENLGVCLTTVLVHGKSGTENRCPVQLIVDRANMQGMKSATTYAKRIGLESVSGIAPEDDDGNAAAKAAPPKNERPAKSMQPAEAPAQQNGVKHASSAEMKRWLVKLDEDLADVHTLVTMESLRASVERGMAANNWPNLDPDGDDYETGFPKMARDKLAAREEQIIAAIDAAEIKDLREPNVLMAGE